MVENWPARDRLHRKEQAAASQVGSGMRGVVRAFASAFASAVTITAVEFRDIILATIEIRVDIGERIGIWRKSDSRTRNQTYSDSLWEGSGKSHFQHLLRLYLGNHCSDAVKLDP